MADKNWEKLHLSDRQTEDNQVSSSAIISQNQGNQHNQQQEEHGDYENDNKISINNNWTNAKSFKFSTKMLTILLISFATLLFYFGIDNLSSPKHHKRVQKRRAGPDPRLGLKYFEQNNMQIVTSSQKKFSSHEENSNKILQINNSLKQKKYALDKRFQITHPLKNNLTSIQSLSLSQIGRKARSGLQNPQYPDYLSQILLYQPYLDLPFCLFVKQTSENQDQRKVDQQIARSVFTLNYTNYITIFFSESDKIGLNQNQLSKLAKQVSNNSGISSNQMFYKIISNETNYYGYKYLMHELCMDKSIVMFVSSVLKNSALINLNRYHQLFPIYFTFAETANFYLAVSFAMRLFDLLDTNDFNGTNSQYLEKPNCQSFFSAALIQLSKKYTKKFDIKQIFESENLDIQNNKWVSSVLKSDKKTIYSRQEYNYLIKLSQTYEIQNIQQLSKKLKTKASSPNANTQLSDHQMISSIQNQQALFLPSQYSLNKKQYAEFNKKYGPIAKQGRQVIINEKPICVTFIARNQSGMNMESKQRVISSLQSILKQNYTKFNVFVYDDGLEEWALESILQLLKQIKFPQNRYTYFKNKISSPIFNIIKCAFTRCGDSQLQIVVDSDFELISQYYFQLINFVYYYNPQMWIIQANYKTDQLKFGASYRIIRDQQYRSFTGRVKDLNFLSPLSAWQVKLVRSIPLNYHLNKNGTWIENYWHKSLMHSLSQLATVHHMQYIPEIAHQASKVHIQKHYNYSNTTISEIDHILSLPILKPLTSLRQKSQQYEKQILQRIAQDEKL